MDGKLVIMLQTLSKFAIWKILLNITIFKDFINLRLSSKENNKIVQYVMKNSLEDCKEVNIHLSYLLLIARSHPKDHLYLYFLDHSRFSPFSLSHGMDYALASVEIHLKWMRKRSEEKINKVYNRLEPYGGNLLNDYKVTVIGNISKKHFKDVKKILDILFVDEVRILSHHFEEWLDKMSDPKLIDYLRGNITLIC